MLTEWKKVYSLNHPADLGSGGFFEDLIEAQNKNADNETQDLFSILYQLEQFRTCEGILHFKLCYPDLADEFPFPCNEWTQLSNPLYENVVQGFKPINITFESALGDFKGLSWAVRGVDNCLMEDFPYQRESRAFCIGSLNGRDGKAVGPPKYLVEQVELLVNPGKEKTYRNMLMN